MIARKINDKNPDVDSRSTSTRTPCSRTTTGASNCGKLGAAGTSSSRRPVATEYPSSEKKILLKRTLMETSHQEIRRSCKVVQAAERGGARILQSVLDQNMCTMWSRSYQSSEVPAQRCDVEPVHERRLMGFILAHTGSRARLKSSFQERKI